MSKALEKSKQQFMQGNTEGALQYLGRLHDREWRTPDALLLSAAIHERLGDREKAGQYYARAIHVAPLPKRKEIGFRAVSHFLGIGKIEPALSALIALHLSIPDDVSVNHSICAILREEGDYTLAAPFAVRLATLATSFDHRLNAGIVLAGLGRYEQAFPLLLAAQQERPDERLAVSELFWCASNLCNFEVAGRMQAKLEQAYRDEGDAVDIRENAFRALVWSDDEAYHALAAERTAALLFPRAVERVAPASRVPGRLRIGYVSSDFCEHATMSLLAGVLETHDRERFEVFGFCHTASSSRQGEMRERFLSAVDHYVDILDLNDDAAARRIAELQIDVLIDLKGFTEGSRLGIFSRRPAPIQMAYLGFPGSVPGVGIDYALTDGIVTPDESAPFYEEKLLRLPVSYQCNDSARERVARSGMRSAHGLPQDAIVFSAFHQPQKIRADVFSAWMSILNRVEGSVLWVAEPLESARDNLRRAAEIEGVDPERLVFAPRVSMTDHLRRLPEADIALDTAPYNGHTTTSDALWCGVPVLTWKGRSFAARVSESLLWAVDLPELVAHDMDGFVRMAVELAGDQPRLESLRKRLLQARDSASLFDTVAWTRALERQIESVAR